MRLISLLQSAGQTVALLLAILTLWLPILSSLLGIALLLLAIATLLLLTILLLWLPVLPPLLRVLAPLLGVALLLRLAVPPLLLLAILLLWLPVLAPLRLAVALLAALLAVVLLSRPAILTLLLSLVGVSRRRTSPKHGIRCSAPATRSQRKLGGRCTSFRAQWRVSSLRTSATARNLGVALLCTCLQSPVTFLAVLRSVLHEEFVVVCSIALCRREPGAVQEPAGVQARSCWRSKPQLATRRFLSQPLKLLQPSLARCLTK